MPRRASAARSRLLLLRLLAGALGGRGSANTDTNGAALAAVHDDRAGVRDAAGHVGTRYGNAARAPAAARTGIDLRIAIITDTAGHGGAAGDADRGPGRADHAAIDDGAVDGGVMDGDAGLLRRA